MFPNLDECGFGSLETMSSGGIPAEARARQIIDVHLQRAGWVVQDRSEIDLYAGGVKANVLFFEKKPASETPWTKEMWVYDFRTNMHFTQKTKSLKRADLEEFVQAFSAGHRQDRVESERFKKFAYAELIARDKTNLDILWLKDDSIVDAADLPAPEVIAEEILESLHAAVEEIQAVLNELNKEEK
jgi:type I restriction enzyme M protein